MKMNDFDDNLTPVLALATNEDLAPLVDYITKSGLPDSLSDSEAYRKHAPNHRAYVAEIEHAIRRFGGNAFINLVRGAGPQYFDIACDVADRLKANYSKKASIEDVESAIIMRILGDSWRQMKAEERSAFLQEMGLRAGVGGMPRTLPVSSVQLATKSSGFLSYKLSLIVSNSISQTILGKGLHLPGNVPLLGGIALFAGPVGVVIASIWKLLDLAGPVYRVTIPCVVHIAMLRQQYALRHCSKCSAPYTAGAKFCQNCGARLDEE